MNGSIGGSEEANETQYKRILLIGDSVARDYRKVLNKKLFDQGYVVDLLAMSHSIFDHLYIQAIRYFIEIIGKEYQYDYVVFNGGTHHGYSVPCMNQENNQKEYAQRLREILKIVEEMDCHIITLGGTPENAAYPKAKNDEIEVRNHILETVSSESGYQFIDLYKQLYDKDLFMKDRYHYLDVGNEYISDIIQKAIGVKG